MSSDSTPALVDKRYTSSSVPGPWRINNIIDGRSLRVKLTAAALDNIGEESFARKAALEVLHGALFRGRMIAQERFQQGADGLDTARLMAAVRDEIISALYDFTTTHIIRSRNPTEAERMAILATGGYGRGVLAPSSDTDLLFLRSYKDSPYTESVIEYMLYALWDLGLKVGNAARTISQCLRLAKEDVTIKTSLLDARFICGHRPLAEDLFGQFQSSVVDGQDAQFIADKLKERDDRHIRQGDARYVVEPNIKEGKGGLRDLQTLYWITKHATGGQTFEDVIEKGPFTDRERIIFLRATRFLWTVRCHLHFLTGRAEERLSFDLQPEIAERLGYRDRGEQLGVERFMKRYFIAARDVGGLTRILSAKLEAEQKKSPEGWRKFLPLGQSKSSDIKGESDFLLKGGRVAFSDDAVDAKDPTNLLKLFLVARDQNADIHPDSLTQVTRDLKQISADTRETGQFPDLVLSALLDGDDPGLVLRRMNEAGVLGRAVPEFGGIVAQTQFNMYHHYTVDEHTIRAIEAMSDIEHGRAADTSTATSLFDELDGRRALYLAMLLHDTGKGKGDQQEIGYLTSTAACRRLGLPEIEVELVGWLVGHHLEMSETAQKRDISDPRTVATFANLVGSLERLRLLYILTIADIKAVGPGVFNAWKGQLLEDLYHSTAAALRGGRTDESAVQADLEERAERYRQELTETVGQLPPILLQMETAYWIGAEREDLLWHANVLSSGGNVVATRLNEENDTRLLLVSGMDRKGLFADLSGALSDRGANIVSAQVHTSGTGEIVDIFVLQNVGGGAYAAQSPHRLEDLIATVTSVLENTYSPSQSTQNIDRREAAFLVDPGVQISNALSADYSVIDVSGRDRPALLHDVAKVFESHELNIHSAHIGSYGERVFDAFYVQTKCGNKILEADMQQLIKEMLLDAIGRNEPDAPQTPARSLKQSRAVDSF